MQTDKQKSALEQYGNDMIQLARQGKFDPVIGRDDEIRRVVRVLARRTKNNPCLIGEPGVGKTALVEGLAQRILKGDVPQSLQCKLISVDVAGLVAGASFRGQFEQRIQDLLKEVKAHAGGIILFIDEVHLLMGAGKAEGAMDAANMLKPMLARGELRLIGATTLNEYREYIEKDAAFERRFQQVFVSEPSVPDTISILRGLVPRYELHHGVRFKDAALVAAATLSKRYINDRHLPDKAVDLIDETGANFRVQLDSQPERIDQLERKVLQLEAEAAALKKDARRDQSSKARLSVVQKQIEAVRAELAPLQAQFEKERGKLVQFKAMKSKLDSLRIKLAEAERQRDTAKVADLQYFAIPEVEAQIEALRLAMDQESESSESSNKLLSDVIGPNDIAETVAKWTGIPVSKLTQTEAGRVLHLASDLKQRVVGQDDAVERLSDAILRSRGGLARPGGPASFLFLGSTGVGKTELAKALADQLFDSKQNILRFDMSEYMEPHSVARMIGAPPGYIGHDSGGQLTEAVRRRPYNVLLFDEIEKAHRDVLNILLQVLDDGRLTDSRGRTVDFSNTIIVMTSNIGSEYLLNGMESFEASRQLVLQALKASFRPEFINRLDEVVVFKPLRKTELREIVRTMVERDLAQRLAERNIRLDFDETAVDFVVDNSYEPAYGARPVRRFIEQRVATELSRRLVAGDIENNSRVSISCRDGELVYELSTGKRDRMET
eukprot:Plantae.Rhodophyta-Rhodochaete_pulchella.ctg1580.p1 GENE.Plantae.Rhodophyta-Rhodochaete_pulchella.ctg1580~~Plantae.Rhodophyta-Rhodochaete_pulchella.ctg1580.p1  ORF type:complete len:741 (+),score=162.43 Plantae.Rhodophyta-Rhodochaete_pulchella.ctg1580:56-2224(+)